MEPALEDGLLEHLAETIAGCARRLAAVAASPEASARISPLRRAGAGCRQWRSAQAAVSGCDPRALAAAVAREALMAAVISDLRVESSSIVVTVTRDAVRDAVARLAAAAADAPARDDEVCRGAAGPVSSPPNAPLTLDNPLFVVQLAHARARRDASGPRWSHSDTVSMDAAATADVVVSLLEAPRRLAVPTPVPTDAATAVPTTADLAVPTPDSTATTWGRAEGAEAGLLALATAYLGWEGVLPPHLPQPEQAAAALPCADLAAATARVLERGMSGLGRPAPGRI